MIDKVCKRVPTRVSDSIEATGKLGTVAKTKKGEVYKARLYTILKQEGARLLFVKRSDLLNAVLQCGVICSTLERQRICVLRAVSLLKKKTVNRKERKKVGREAES